MPTAEKIIEKMKAQPNGIRPEEIKKVYNIIVKKMNDESGEYYYSRVMELDGCRSDGDTFDEAYRNITEAMKRIPEDKTISRRALFIL